MIDLEYQYKLLNIKNILAGLSVGIIAKVKYFDGEARLRSSLGYDTQKDFHVPVPMVGVAAKIGLIANILEARAKIAGMGYSDNYIYEAQGGYFRNSLSIFKYIRRLPGDVLKN